MSILCLELIMKLSLLTDIDVSRAFATHLRKRREKEKWSREHLVERSTVPASTIKKFELQGKISLRQLLLLWQCLDDLNNLYAVVDPKKANKPRIPRTIEEVLQDEF